MRVEQIGHALAMLGAERDRIAEARGDRLRGCPIRPTRPSALLATSATGVSFGAQPAGDFLVERGDALARVDQEQGGVGLAHRGLGLVPHPPGQAGRVLILEAGGVDDPEVEAEQAAPRPRAGRGSRPGRSSTSASFLPTSRLNRVDLPTLGRPTMATVGRRHGHGAP